MTGKLKVSFVNQIFCAGQWGIKWNIENEV
jgi:hypothetical protein